MTFMRQEQVCRGKGNGCKYGYGENVKAPHNSQINLIFPLIYRKVYAIIIGVIYKVNVDRVPYGTVRCVDPASESGRLVKDRADTYTEFHPVSFSALQNVDAALKHDRVAAYAAN